MKETNFAFTYKVYSGLEELPVEQKELLIKAQEATSASYAPYSNFFVGAAAKLVNGKLVTGSNQENASFPAGLCAERVLLASIASLFPKTAIDTLAISYKAEQQKSDHPISPCGICRQSLQEFESQVKHPVKLILAGLEGPVYVIDSASKLLPLAFTSEELK